MTHCMDPEQERAVWERVAAGRGRGQTPAAQPAPASEPEQPPQDSCQPPCRIRLPLCSHSSIAGILPGLWGGC